MKHDKRTPKPKLAPPLSLRLTVDDRELLRRCAELEEVSDVELISAILVPELAKRCRRHNRTSKSKERELAMKEAAKRKDKIQIALFDVETGHVPHETERPAPPSRIFPVECAGFENDNGGPL